MSDPKTNRSWRQCTMREAILHCRNRMVVERNCDQPPYPPDNADRECFEDGTAIACKSDWDDYESGIATNPPLWWIYS